MSMKNPPHPGLGLRDDFDALGLSITQAAEALGVSRSQLHRVVSGKSDISAELALRLEIVIGVRADSWLRQQAAYNAAQVRLRIDQIAKGLKRLHVAYMQPLPMG